jgi:2-amino-4-hydroxy-6-hydroxymethyldihydropteridine diphosphokinase
MPIMASSPSSAAMSSVEATAILEATPILATLGLGGNMGDTHSFIRSARDRLAASEHVKIRAVSRLYRTPAWGITDQPPFLNAAILVSTRLGPHAVLALCLGIEQQLGRVRDLRWGPRKIDIDILTYGERVVRDPGLTIPHLHLHERAFALVPLADVAPDMMLDGLSIAQRANAIARDGLEDIGPV